MPEPPSRTPEDWRLSVHAKQRIKYRMNPSIPDWIPTKAIEEGTYITDHPDHDFNGEAWFKIIEQVSGTVHEFTVTVDPDKMTVCSVGCFCHLNNTACIPNFFHDRG